MDNSKSSLEQDQELIRLRLSLRQEKLKRAEELLAHRLVYSAISLVILFVILLYALSNASNWVEWPCLIGFFGVALFILGKIALHYTREKEDVEK